MNASKFFAGALVGIGVALLLAPETRKDLTNNLEDTAGKWKSKFKRMAGKTGVELQDLQDIMKNEVAGMTDDVRNRISKILDESTSSAKNIKRNFASELK